MCEHTVNLPSTGQSVYGNTIHIINDLREDARFSDRPFVVEEPKARFYAGVPITTTKGVNIGAFCILDGKPRDGLDDVDITFLGDMAETIMSHLDMVRAKAEYGRSTQMVAGLGAFVDGNLREQDESSSSQVPSPPSSNSARKTSAEDSTRLTASDDSSHLPESQPSTPKGRSVPVQQPPESPSVAGIGAPISPPLPSGPGHTNDTKTFSSQSGDLRAQLITPDVQTTFQRAARIIRDAVDVDGAAFFDASIGTYGGLLDTSEEDSSGHSGFASSEPETSNIAGNRHNRRRQSVFGVEGTHCPVLSFSGAPSGVDTENADPRSTKCPSFTERFLRSLLRRHPHGKIWNFDDQGNSSSDDEPSEDSVREKPNQEILDSLQDNGTDETFQRRRRKERSRVDHGRKIQQYFPGVRSFALVGMWDQLKGRWFSACAIWTYSPLRLLSSEGEVNFVAAFCDVIMAEVHRLESRDSDLAKTDFISSISHELRSPLHGILGSVDCLQEHECDEFSRTLVSQIEICGRTLLDIVNHLLDFSKIQQYTRKPSSQVDSSHDRRESLSTVRNTASHGGPRSLSFDVSLGALTEEVVEAAVYSFCSSKDQRTVLDRKVTVTLDIDCSSTVDWRCRIATGGWRRLCINLVSNALKYTTVGHVRISLSSIPAPYPTKAFNAVLKVMDSGCGMSEAFMQNDLFRAFVQEDSLAEGTGLGMSLVARIAKAMGGKVDVQSAKGSGTTVIVTVPVDHPRHDKDRIETQQQVHRSDLHDLSVGIIDFAHTNYSESIGYHPLAEEGNLLLYASLQKTFSELGLEVCKVTPADLRVANIHIITESTLIQWRESQSELDHDRLSEEQAMAALAGRALMVLCGTVASERLLRSSPPKFLRRTHVEFITQPVGPDRLVKSIQACLAALAKECKTSYEKSPAITKVPSHIGVVWGEERLPEPAATWPLQLNGRTTPPPEPNRRDGNDESSPTSVAQDIRTGLPERRRISARGSQPSPTAGVSCFQASEDANGLGRARSTSREHHGAQPVGSEQPQPRTPLLVVDDNVSLPCASLEVICNADPSLRTSTSKFS